MAHVRGLMWVLMASHWFCAYAVRQGLPQLTTFLVAARSLTATQEAALLTAFFPGYVCGQVPWGLLARRVGGQRTLGVSLALTAALVLALPITASVRGLCALIAGVGFCQGALMPGCSSLQQHWIGPSRERALALQVPHMGRKIGSLISAPTVPMLAASHWQRVPLVWGAATAAIAAVWAALATETPRAWRGAAEDERCGARAPAQPRAAAHQERQGRGAGGAAAAAALAPGAGGGARPHIRRNRPLRPEFERADHPHGAARAVRRASGAAPCSAAAL